MASTQKQPALPESPQATAPGIPNPRTASPATSAGAFLRSASANLSAASPSGGLHGAMAGSIGRYKLVDTLGEGGMSVVYRAQDERLGRDVAVKVMHRHLARDPEARKRFAREARAVARLTQRNIPEIYDYSDAEGELNYLVTEIVDGPALGALLRRSPAILPEIGIMLVVGVADALEHAHAHRIIHRDVKPENVLVGRNGVVKLTDFGIAQIVDLESMTMTGTLIGSPAHMAPEQVLGQRDLDYRVDVWGLGTVIYMAITGGALPFEGTSPHAVLRRIVDGDYVDPRRKNPHVDAQLARIVAGCLTVDREQRYGSAKEVRDALARWLEVRGLGEVEPELRAFMAAPEDYNLRLRERLTGLFLALGDEAAIERRRHKALAFYGRVLALDPDHPDAVERMRSLTTGLKLRRWALLGLGLASILAASIALIAVVTSPAPLSQARARGLGVVAAPQPAPPHPSLSSAAATEPAPTTPPTKSTADPTAGPATGPAARPGSGAGGRAGTLLSDAVHKAQRGATRRHHAAAIAARRRPRPPTARAIPRAVPVRLTAFPPKVSITIAGRTIGAGETIKLVPGRYVAELTNPACPDCLPGPNRRPFVVQPQDPTDASGPLQKHLGKFQYAPMTLDIKCTDASYVVDDRGRQFGCNQSHTIPVTTTRAVRITLRHVDAEGTTLKSQPILVRPGTTAIVRQ